MFENPEVAFGGTRPMLAMIETIYAAVQRPELWQDVMEGIAEAAQANSAVLIAQLPHGVLAPSARTHPDALNAYVNYYGGVNTLSAACDAKFSDGTVRYGHLAMPEQELLRTEIYNDFFRPNNMHWSMGMNVPLGDLPIAYLSCQRPSTSAVFSELDGLIYETLAPHIRQALFLHTRLATVQAQALGWQAALDVHDHAVLGLGPDGQIVLQNASAESLLRTSRDLRVVQGRLRCSSAAPDKRLQGMVTAATGRNTEHTLAAGSSMLIEQRPPGRPLQLTFSRFDATVPGQSLPVAALVFLSDPASAPRSRSAIMADLYHLTPAESRIADLLLKGLDAARIAEQLHITLETARFHVKRILSKTGARRQPELIRLMLSLPGL